MTATDKTVPTCPSCGEPMRTADLSNIDGPMWSVWCTDCGVSAWDIKAPMRTMADVLRNLNYEAAAERLEAAEEADR